jgi:glycerol kinase
VELLGVLADGGASSNSFLMQLQADLMNRKVSCSERAEVSALGVAYMALAGFGLSAGDDQMHARIFAPQPDREYDRQEIKARWDLAIAGLMR